MLPAGDYVARGRDARRRWARSRPFTVTHADATLPTPGGAATNRRAISVPARRSRSRRRSTTSIRKRCSHRSRQLLRRSYEHRRSAALPPALERRSAAAGICRAATGARRRPRIPRLCSRGIAKMSQGDMAAAEVNLRDTLKASPEFFPAAFYLGADYAATGRTLDAVAIWQTALTSPMQARHSVICSETRCCVRIARPMRSPRSRHPLAGCRRRHDAIRTALAQGGQAADALKVLDPYLKNTPPIRPADAGDAAYEAKAANRPIDSVENDRAKFNRYFDARRPTASNLNSRNGGKRSSIGSDRDSNFEVAVEREPQNRAGSKRHFFS